MTREDAIHFANCLKNNYTVDLNDMEAFCDMAIKALEQEPFINKPCVSSGVCEHDKNEVLDKIRAEIEPTRKMYLEMNDIDWLNGCDYVLSVIDKYKAESESEE